MSASESGDRKAVNSIPSWAGRMALLALGSICIGLASWALFSVSQLEAKHAAMEAKSAAMQEARGQESRMMDMKFANYDRELIEMKLVQQEGEKRMESWLQRLNDKIDRIGEAVGARAH